MLCTALLCMAFAATARGGPQKQLADHKSPRIFSFYIEPSVVEDGWVMIKTRGAKAVVKARGLNSVKIFYYSTGTGMGEMPPGEIGPLKRVATSPGGDRWEIEVPDDLMVTNFWCEGVDAHGRKVKGIDLGNVGWDVSPD